MTPEQLKFLNEALANSETPSAEMTPEQQKFLNEALATPTNGFATKGVTLSAGPDRSGFLGGIERSLEDAASDFKYGSKLTMLGKALAAAGASPMNSIGESIGDFMGSPVYGVLNAARGVSQLPQGKIQEGAGNVMSGVSEALTIPSLITGIGVVPKAGKAALAKILSKTSDIPLPFLSRAGKRFAEVESRARNVPVDMTDSLKVLNEAEILGSSGNYPPKVIGDLSKATRGGQPMTYDRARKFSSAASGLTGQDALNSNPTMKRQVAKLAEALANANRGAAQSVGMGKQYDLAMKEYRMAQQVRKTAKTTAKVVAGAAGLAGANRIANQYGLGIE